MAAAIVDLDINEGDTFIMTLEFWSDEDNTLPIDITLDTFIGSFKIGNKAIPMTMTTLLPATNALEAKVDYSLMVDLSSKGKYDIDQLTVDNEKYRVIQGNVRISQEVTV